MGLLFNGAERAAWLFNGGARQAIKYNGAERWNAVPNGALIWNYKIISSQMTNFTHKSGGRGTVISSSYTDFKIRSGSYNDYYKNRLVDTIDFNTFSIPSWAKNVIIDVEFGYIAGAYPLARNVINVYTLREVGSSSVTSLFSGSTPNIYSITIPKTNIVGSYLAFRLDLNTGSNQDIPSSPFYVTIKIKNMYFV